MVAAVTPQGASRGAAGVAESPSRSDARSQPHDARSQPHDARFRRRPRLSARGAFLLVVVMLLLLAAVAPVRNLMDQRSQLAELQRQTVQLQQENGQLQQGVDLLNDPRYLEQLARGCLGMVNPGEIAFVIVPKHGAPAQLAC